MKDYPKLNLIPNNIMLCEDNTVIHGLWIGDTLSPIEQLTIQSFIDHGHEFHLWTYQPIKFVPEKAILQNAADIIPEHRVFKYQHQNKHGHGKGSYAGFSDIFRYKLLYEKGGWWVDMDITCLQPLTFETPYVFRYHHKSHAVGNLMKCPKNSALMLYCYEAAVKQVTSENKNWMLPIEILNEGIRTFDLSQYITDCSNIDSFPVVLGLLSHASPIPQHWKVIHWMNEEFRRMDINKNTFLPNSVLSHFLSRHRIGFSVWEKMDIWKAKMQLSRINYLLQNIGTTLRWYWPF